MHKNLKLWLILAAVLIVAGLILVAIPMSIYSWDFTRLGSVTFETNTHELREAFHSIQLDTDTADISILPSPDGVSKVVCHEPENLTHSVEVTDGTLTIREVDSRQWHQHIGFSFGSAKITVYLPQVEYQTLTIRESTGDIEISEGFLFSNIDIKTSTGDVNSCASARENMRLHTNTGDIYLEGVSAANLDITVSTGDVTIVDAACDNLSSKGSTGDLNLKNVIAGETFQIERSSGDITFSGADAAEVFVTTDTGDVSGTLLTSKVFYVETDTGNVDVPVSTTGGICQIHTDTGDVDITVKGIS
jgi:DUF4097 and DUF4098 domain-containing protein YvlB